MADLSIFKLDSETITIKDTTAREAADSAKALATTASGNATTALNKINELESEKADAIISSASGAIASFQDGAESTAKELVVAIEPVQEGTGDPSPDNVRPISGWTGAKVTRTGKNLYPYGEIPAYDYSFFSKSKALTDADNPVLLIGGNTYVLSWQNENSDAKVFVRVWRKNGDLLINEPNVLNMRMSSYVIENIFVYNPAGFWYSGLTESSTNTAIINPTEDLWLDMTTQQERGICTNVQLELGSTATAYEPYQGNTYDITFPAEAGTVYGGTLDVTNGVLTVDRVQIASYAGETLPSTWISDRDVYSAGATPTTGAQVVYELATPITYQLTPTEVRTLLGQNNIWADAGDTSVTYKADTKLYIDKKFTELQALILEN